MSIISRQFKPGSIVGDLFCGTAAVSSTLKAHGYKVIANDSLYFCSVMAGAVLLINEEPKFAGLQNIHSKHATLLDSPYDSILAYLNELPQLQGFIYQNYSLEGTAKAKYKRNYFVGENAVRIDAIRRQIENWYKERAIQYDEKCLLLSDLLNAVTTVSNTAGTYGYFLSELEPRALKPILLKRSRITPGRSDHLIFNKDANELVDSVTMDLAYLDPPYNWRQYAAYYHLLETIARYDSPVLSGKSGLRPWESQRSRYSIRTEVKSALNELVHKIKARAILLSYNSDGLLKHSDIMQILSDVGEISFQSIMTPRYISASGGSNNEKVKEYFYYVDIKNRN
jgi:adenine-specific DNA-methyltransferase